MPVDPEVRRPALHKESACSRGFGTAELYLWRQGPQIRKLVRGFFYFPVRHFTQRRSAMSQREIVFAKKGALATKDWDTFQAIIRTCLKPVKHGDDGKAATRRRPAAR